MPKPRPKGGPRRRTDPSATPRAPRGAPSALARLALETPRVQEAATRLAARGLVVGTSSRKVSARVDPNVLAAAARELGTSPDDISGTINAALTIVAAPDPFKAWLENAAGTLPADFEFAI